MGGEMAEMIPIGADHAGFALKERLVKELAALGYAPEDVGTNSTASTDYPDYAHVVADQVSRGEAKRGVLLCGTGLGMSYAANRHHVSGRRWRGRRKSPDSPGCITTPTCWSCRPAS